MEANQNIDMLKRAVIQRFGRKIEDKASCKQLSVEIFLRTGNYISKYTIECLFGLSASVGPANPKIFDFLAKYSGLK